MPFLENQPELSDHLQFEWGAFRDLTTDRQTGLGVGPIPWSSFDRYARRHGIVDPDEFDRFCHLMRVMDDAYRVNMEERKSEKT